MLRQPTIHQISWFLDLNNNNQLDLNPPYQRKSVWNIKDRRFFLDTIFRNYPTPPVFLHREIDDSGKSTYHVVDGKQRLETIIAFASNKIAIDTAFGDENLNGKKFKDLSPDDKRKFWDYILVADYVNSIAGTNINDIFDRVNRTSKNLEPQELRHARFDGWFIKLVESESMDTFWTDFRITTAGRERRMKNIQFISELILVIVDQKVVGFNHDYLDKKYAELDYPEEENPDFDTEIIIHKKGGVKHIIKAMNEINNCVTEYAKTQANFYTLWALVTLYEESISNIKTIAESYASFMAKVFDISSEQMEAADDNIHDLHLKYAVSTRGASTDLRPREERLLALISILS